jgi:hypothetical protein
MRIWIVSLIVVLGSTFVGSTGAKADIIHNRGTVMQEPDPSFRYTFHSILTDVPNPPGVEIAMNDFFTVYDLVGVIQGTNEQPDNWAASFSLVGRTPAGTDPVDNDAIFNVTWTYIGADPILAPQDLGNFSVQSTDGSLRNLVYAGQDTLLSGGTVGNMGTVPITFVPEPTSLLLTGLGLPATWLVMRRRRRLGDGSAGTG